MKNYYLREGLDTGCMAIVIVMMILVIIGFLFLVDIGERRIPWKSSSHGVLVCFVDAPKDANVSPR